MYFDVNALQIGQDVAVDSGFYSITYRFGKVTKVTSTEVHVKLEGRDEVKRFSKRSNYEVATGSDARSSSKRYRDSLCDAARARETIARTKAYNELRAQQNEIQSKIAALSKTSVDKTMANELRALAVMVEIFNERHN